MPTKDEVQSMLWLVELAAKTAEVLPEGIPERRAIELHVQRVKTFTNRLPK